MLDPRSLAAGVLIAAGLATPALAQPPAPSFQFEKSDASDPTGATNEVKAFKDPRVTGQAGLTTTLYKNLSFAFNFTLRYDGSPAPRPLPASAKGAPSAPAFHPFADRLDTLTEATLVFTFL
jgi:hypothetical protein